jgi:hypothetical protein
MIAILIIVVALVAVGAVAGVLAVLAVGIHREEKNFSFIERSRDPLTRGTRAINGLYTRM